MTLSTKGIKEVDLLFDELGLGGAIGMADTGDTIEMHFDNPNQIEYLIHGLTELSNLIADEYNKMSGEGKNDL